MTSKHTSQAPTQKDTMSHLELTLKGHEESVYDVAFIRGTHLLVTGSNDKSLRVWALDMGKQVGEPLLGHDAAVWGVAASPGGCWIVSGGENGSILVWEVATYKRDLKRVPISFEGHKGGIQGVVFAPDSETFASASEDETVCVWKREAGEIVLGPVKVGSLANSVLYSLDGKKLTAGTEEHIIVWNAETGEELLKIEQWAFRVTFTPDGLHLISGDYKDIQISDATTRDIIKQFDAHTAPFESLSIASNGTNLPPHHTTRRRVPLSESEKEPQQVSKFTCHAMLCINSPHGKFLNLAQDAPQYRLVGSSMILIHIPHLDTTTTLLPPRATPKAPKSSI
ncbi:WD40 repeat-like protein [Suillus weaverae]|nr:WD40 repeat-like protein [Suillus weaverae]